MKNKIAPIAQHIKPGVNPNTHQHNTSGLEENKLVRSFVWQCGSLISKVILIKKVKKLFAILDAGTTKLIPLALY